MAKRNDDIVLRDRLQFTLNGSGNLPVVYGRLDLSDWVSVVNEQGLNVKEITYQLRRAGEGGNTCVFDPVLSDATVSLASIQVFATTTAYEDANDVGIGSPNVLNNYTMSTTREGDPATGSFIWENQERFRGVYDLHPDGYTLVTDLLIGVATDSCTKYNSETIEIDIMMIAEPRKITKTELQDMLTQAQDL